MKTKTIKKRVAFIFAVFAILFQMSFAAIADEMETTGDINISLSHVGDNADNDTIDAYTNVDMPGYLTINPENLVADKENVTIKLSVPKTYLTTDPSKVVLLIPEFKSTYVHTISEVKEDDESYYVELIFEKYDKSQALSIPYRFKLETGQVPADYKLEVTATISYDDVTKTSNSIFYQPKYDDYQFIKWASNTYIDNQERFAGEAIRDGSGGYIDPASAESIQFKFELKSINPNTVRTLEKIVITDNVPTYIDKDGNEVKAILDAENSPGWVLSMDGSKISKTFDTASLNINQTLLYFKFPNMKLDQDPITTTRLFKEASNSADIELTPLNKSAGEDNITLSDDIKFVFADRAGGAGYFDKVVVGNRYFEDQLYQKQSERVWRLDFKNTTNKRLNNFVVSDHGLDDRLKFTRLTFASSLNETSNEANNQYLLTNSLVLAYKEDGTHDEYTFTGSQIVFDTSKVYVGFDFKLVNDATYPAAARININAYTKLKSPETTHYNENDAASNILRNDAQITYNYDGEAQNVINPSNNNWMALLPLKENLDLSKYITSNSTNINTGDKLSFRFNVRGLLDTSKNHQLTLIDLLPENIRYIGPSSDSLGNTIETVENYHNTGKIALIYHLSDSSIETLYKTKNLDLYVNNAFLVTGDLPSGSYVNELYLVGNNVPEPVGNNIANDIYDLNDNGKTDDKIHKATASYSVLMPKGVHANKLIQKEDFNPTIGTQTFDFNEKFNYILRITNSSDVDLTELVAYDSLPKIGDINPLNKSKRDSQYRVELREAIDVPSGYDVYYTEDTSVYSKTMDEALSSVDWKTINQVSLNKVTAFKILGSATTKLGKNQKLDIIVPVKNMKNLNTASKEYIKYVNVEDGGIIGKLHANNSYAYTNKEFPGNRQANSVTSEIFIGGFAIQKVDEKNKNLKLEGAKFELTSKNDANFKQEVVTDTDGIAVFRDLISGKYALKEITAPNGYAKLEKPIEIEITIDNIKGVVNVKAAGKDVVANMDKPWQVENKKAKKLNLDPKIEPKKLPKTGSDLGLGILLSLLSASAFIGIRGFKKNNLLK